VSYARCKSENTWETIRYETPRGKKREREKGKKKTPDYAVVNIGKPPSP
jgi:hypothetical protein